MSEHGFERFVRAIIPGYSPYDFTNKPRAIGDHIGYMFSRCLSMFKWTGLPASIPSEMLEKYLLINGSCAVIEHNSTLYAVTGGAGGEPDPYYLPTVYSVSNPALNLSKHYSIGEECTIVVNDPFYMGLLPLCSRYATLLCESELSLRTALINTRIVDLISAPDDSTKASAEEYLRNIEAGKQGIIAENAFLNGIQSRPFGGNTHSDGITNVLEAIQYVKGSFFNEIGLNANFNMKRESINAGETDLNTSGLLPLVDTMLHSRQKSAERMNSFYGLNVTVSLDSSWEDEHIQADSEAGQQNGG